MSLGSQGSASASVKAQVLDGGLGGLVRGGCLPGVAAPRTLALAARVALAVGWSRAVQGSAGSLER